MIPRKHNSFEIDGTLICNSSARAKVLQEIAEEQYHRDMDDELLKDPEYEYNWVTPENGPPLSNKG